MVTTMHYTASEPALNELYSDLALHDLQPPWELKGLLTSTPTPRMVPFRWRLDELRELGQRALAWCRSTGVATDAS